jgi:chromosome segregation protein
MGETSLKSLRAKKVTDLIHTGSRTAEVTMIMEDGHNGGGHRYEIKRAIREDGKIRYRFNEKRTTRTTILEALKKHNLDESGRNTIAQGEVQRVISMNGKERRTIIDSVAGIADFEEKKKEAVHELDIVNTRIKEARLVLGERKTFLEDLGREREVALKHIDAKKSLTDAKGTLLKTEMDRLEKDLKDSSSHEEKLLTLQKAKEAEMAEAEKAITDVDANRTKISQDIQAKQKTNALIRKLEELKASCGSKKQLIDDKEASVKTLKSEADALSKEIEKEKHAMEKLGEGLTELDAHLKEAEEKLAAEGGMAEDVRVTGFRKSLEAQEKELSSVREKLAVLESEANAAKQLIDAKTAEAESISPKESGESKEGEDPDALRRQADRIAKDIERSFSRTKDINSKMAELDKEMLTLKEKAAIFRVRSSPQLANPALGFISELMKDKKTGIYGTVADLISFDNKHTNAVEAAGGARLLYVVVDSVDTATATIEKLKAARAGRATFIPLDTVRTNAPAKASGFSSVIEVVEFKNEVRRAVEYVFADTLLVDSVSDAKKLGIGTGRMVTLDGEIFERSGIVSGGRTQGGMLGANQLRKIENELNEVKETKDAFLQELYSIREDESKMRAEKSQIEIKIKTMEMARKMDDERRKEGEGLIKRKEQLGEEIARLGKEIEVKHAEKEKLKGSLGSMEKKASDLKAELHAAEEEFKKHTEATSKKRADMSARVSSLRAKIEGKKSESELRLKELSAKEERLGKLGKDEKDAHHRIGEVKKQIKDEETEITHVEGKISAVSKDIEKLFEQLKSYEEELESLGGKRSKIRADLDKAGRDMGQFSVKKATAATRLEDIKAEFESYSSAEFIKASREELNRMITDAETTLTALGNVNMAAIDMYGKKKAEIDDVESRIAKLDEEREAILSMISEIDEHKKAAFFETFDAVSQNFSGMFKHIHVGQGHLQLSDPANPFESGLFIKLRRGNQDHALDALSGGEKTLVALMFIFALQLFKPAPFYILDEVDAALDKPNSKNLADLVATMSRDSQFILVTHNDTVMSNAESVIGVTKSDNVSKLVGIKLKQVVTQT